MAAIAAAPELTRMRKGEASFYDLDDYKLDIHDFADLLDCGPADGADEESEWPGEFADAWGDVESGIDESGMRGFEAIVRLVTVELASPQGYPYGSTAVVFWTECGGRHVPVVVSGEAPMEEREIASYSWAVDNIGAPMSSAGGVKLVLVADGLTVGIPRDDEFDMGRETELLDYPLDNDPDGQAEVLAKWIDEVEATFSAAVWLEPLDPHGNMTEEEKADWEAALDNVDASFSLDADRDLRRSLRRRLADDGFYRAVRDALADPDGEDGQALKDALDDGDYGTVIRGLWLQ
jgi:hypothetical protein